MPQKPDLAKREVWRRRLRYFERDGASIREFCRRIGVPARSFYYWRRKLQSETMNTASSRARQAVVAPTRRRRFAARSRHGATKAGLTFLPVQIAGSRPAGIEVHLPNGTRITVPCDDHDAISVVLAALLNHPQEPPSC